MLGTAGRRAPVQAFRAVARAQAGGDGPHMELWLRLTVIEAHPALLAHLAAAFGEAEKVLAGAVAQRTGTRVGVDVHPTLLAGVAGVAMRTSLHRWLASDFTASPPTSSTRPGTCWPPPTGTAPPTPPPPSP